MAPLKGDNALIVREPRGSRLRVYQFIATFIETEAWAPTLDEIAAFTGLAKSTVRQHMAQLERDGLIERGPGRRQLRIPQRKERS